jgi:hypothetical protein
MKETKHERNNQVKDLFLKGPKEAKIRRHTVSDNDIRFTVPTLLGHRKLVAWAKNGVFVWICNGFSA